MVFIKQRLSLQDRDSFSLKLEDTENWLYEEGEDQQKQVYIDKLAELKVDEMRYWFFEIWNCCPFKKNEKINHQNRLLLETGRADSKPIHGGRGASKSFGWARKTNPAVHEGRRGL